MHLDRAGADVAQLLRRFENIIALAPVRYFFFFAAFRFFRLHGAEEDFVSFLYSTLSL